MARPFSTFYTYDVMDHLIQVNQGVQQRTYVYGGLGHLLSAQTPESGLVTYSYQTGGAPCSTDTQNVCQRTDARNITSTYQYDTLNRLRTVTYSDGTPSVTYNYDAGGAPAFALGRLTSMTDGIGSETYTYDRFGRISAVAKIISGTTYSLGYTYDYIGDIKSLTYPDNSVVNQSYDAVGRLAQISSGGTNYLTVPSGSYNAASLPQTLTYGSGVQAAIGYNNRFQLSSLDYAQGSTHLLNLAYNYNQTVGGNLVNNGQIQGITDTRGNAYSTSYTYDALGRLAQGQTLDLTAANTWKLGWVYDRYGNRSQQNILGGTLPVTSPQLTINPATNHITTAGYSYDANGAGGNLTADGTGHTYAYDAENRLKSMDGTAATYSYDGKGLRVKKVVATTTTAYIFSGSKVIAEYANGTLSARYVYAGSQLLATVAAGTTYHYPDHLSARLETNASGTVNRTFGHLPFGETWYETGTAIKWKFTSYERDSESGLDYAMFRYDASRLGRFMTPDPLGGTRGDPQSLNRYAYVQNSPIDLIDPMGLDDFWACFLDASSNGHCGGPGQNGPIGGKGWGTNFYLGYSADEARHEQIIHTGIDPWTAPKGPEWTAPGRGDPELRALGCLVNQVTDRVWCPGTGAFLHDPPGTFFQLSITSPFPMDILRYPKKTRTTTTISATQTTPQPKQTYLEKLQLCIIATELSMGSGLGAVPDSIDQTPDGQKGTQNSGTWQEYNPVGHSQGAAAGNSAAFIGGTATCMGAASQY